MNKINVMVVGFGDWNENYVGMDVWEGWNEWYGCKVLIEGWVKSGEWNNYVCECNGNKDEVEVVDWKKYVDKFEIVKNMFLMDVYNYDYNEFGYMIFNVDMFEKLEEGKVVLKNGCVVDDVWGDDWYMIGGEWDENLNKVIVCDGELSRFKLVGCDSFDDGGKYIKK